jgi:hypothetical protein
MASARIKVFPGDGVLRACGKGRDGLTGGEIDEFWRDSAPLVQMVGDLLESWTERKDFERNDDSMSPIRHLNVNIN